MSAPFQFGRFTHDTHLRRTPSQRAVQELQRMLENELSPQAHHRRAETLLYYDLGLNGQELADALHVHFPTVYADLRAFEREGLIFGRPLPTGGAPRRISDQPLRTIWHWVESSLWDSHKG